jgi:tRNA(Ile)-lysidine synthase
MDFHLNMHSQLVAKISSALKTLPNQIDLADEPCVFVSISGGPDSTALLVALKLVSQAFGLKLRACHVNHKIRGEESDRDEQFCREQCDRLSIPIDVYQESNAVLQASESSLREVRYAFLSRCATAHNSKIVFLGHTNNDQVETILFRILRGTSPTGLTGMKVIHQLENGIWLVRPMLNCFRDEVNDFLASCQISARMDSSNLTDKYARNFLRNQVIPLCMSRFPTMARQINRLREVSSNEDEFLDDCTVQMIDGLGGIGAVSWSTTEFKSCHAALQRRAVTKTLDYHQVEVSFENVQTVLNMMANQDQSGRLTLSERWDLIVDRDKLSWLDKCVQVKEPSVPQPISVKVPGYTMILSLGKILSVEQWQQELAPAEFPERTSMTAVVDLSSIHLPLVLRASSQDDSIRPLGMSQDVSLKRYLHSNNRFHRKLGEVILADHKEVLWVPGVGLSEKIKVRGLPTHQISIAPIADEYKLA